MAQGGLLGRKKSSAFPWRRAPCILSCAKSFRASHSITRRFSRKQRGSCSFKLIKRFKTGAYIEPLVRLLTGTSGRIALPSRQLGVAKVSKSNLGQNREI